MVQACCDAQAGLLSVREMLLYSSAKPSRACAGNNEIISFHVHSSIFSISCFTGAPRKYKFLQLRSLPKAARHIHFLFPFSL